MYKGYSKPGTLDAQRQSHLITIRKLGRTTNVKPPPPPGTLVVTIYS